MKNVDNKVTSTDISEIVAKQREYFNTGVTKSLEFRMSALRKLKAAVNQSEKEISDALKADLNRSSIEAYLIEIGVLNGEIKFAIKELPNWVKARKVRTGIALFPAKCFIVSEPYGVALIMSPWNYPLVLAGTPLVGALAAGNCAILKPSGCAPASSAALAKIIASCFTPEYCTVVQGTHQENTALLQQRYDFIFFTGSVPVGKLVMEAAAKNLTPVGLELGGKSPVIIDETANIKLAAKRLVFGKYMNAGATCAAPDYVLVQESKREELVSQLRFWIEKMYPKGSDGRIIDYPRIVNKKHFDRLLGLMKGAHIVVGGVYRAEDLTIDPTVMTDVKLEDPVMQEEIFGPLLPVLTFHELGEAIRIVRSRPKPLALYLFTSSRAVQKRILNELSFGGGCFNDVIMQISSPRLPVGGVGDSGIGSCHGKAGFDTFTHYRSIVDKANWLDLNVRYRPYTERKQKIIHRFY